MKARHPALLVFSAIACFALAGCHAEDQKPLSPQDRATMMDRSHVPAGYLEANRRRMGGGGAAGQPGAPGPVMPPTSGIPSTGK